MMLRVARASLTALLDRLVPPTCGFCGLLTDGGRACSGCRSDLRWIVAACRRCAVPLAGSATQSLTCGTCQQRPPSFTRVGAPLHYEFPIDATIKALKFNGRIDLAPMFGELLLPWLVEHGDCVDALVPVPLHRWRQARRGYNQADELAAVLSRLSGLPVLRAAHRCRATSSQSELSGAARRVNVRGAFRVTERLDGEHLLLIDDVMTTGATCEELAKLLLRCGAASVSVLCIARASSPRALRPRVQ